MLCRSDLRKLGDVNRSLKSSSEEKFEQSQTEGGFLHFPFPGSQSVKVMLQVWACPDTHHITPVPSLGLSEPGSSCRVHMPRAGSSGPPSGTVPENKIILGLCFLFLLGERWAARGTRMRLGNSPNQQVVTGPFLPGKLDTYQLAHHPPGLLKFSAHCVVNKNASRTV